MARGGTCVRSAGLNRRTSSTDKRVRPVTSASGMARVALRTDAAVVPAFMIWDKALRKYRLRFEPALELIRTGDDEADAVANTALFTQAIERVVRKYPEQWLWIHRRWKTRPEGEPPIY